MVRLALVLVLLSAVAEAQPRGRGTRSRFASGDSPLLSLLSPPGAGYDSTNVSLTTGSGGAVTFTRADTHTCQDSSGAIRSLASGQPCVVDGAALRVRSAVTNLALRSGELDNASWISLNTPTRTANSWDFGEGSATGETLADDDGAATEGITQTVSTATVGAYTFACYVQSGTTALARFNVNVTGGTGTTTCQFSDLSTTTQRKSCTITAGTGVTAVAGQVVVGTGAGDIGSIKVGGCQLVAASVPGDYCPTGAASDACAAETATVATPATLSRTEGCAKICIAPSWTGSAAALGGCRDFLDLGASANLAYSCNNNYSADDGTNAATVAANWSSGVRQCFVTDWGPSIGGLRVTNLSTGTASAVNTSFTTFGAFGANLGVGVGTAGTQQALSNLDVIQLGARPGACK